jgi:hypothetical protein
MINSRHSSVKGVPVAGVALAVFVSVFLLAGAILGARFF